MRTELIYLWIEKTKMNALKNKDLIFLRISA